MNYILKSLSGWSAEEAAALDTLLYNRHVPLPQAASVSEWEALRPSLLETFETNVYGRKLPRPDEVIFTDITPRMYGAFMAGHAVRRRVEVKAKRNGLEASFPFELAIPANADAPVPVFVCLNFDPGVLNAYQPTEEIIDNGFATAGFCAPDVVSDDGDFTNGLAPLYYGPDDLAEDGYPKAADAAGKIGLWALAASLVLDYLETVPEINASKAAVIGHSRMGKTALWAGVLDPRFFAVISNDSGCGGASISRGKRGETIGKITTRFPYWFCRNYQRFADHESEAPFDQHMLLALIAPRLLLVGSAERDLWADPEAEELSLYAASKVYALYRRADADRPLFHYHLRHGDHYLSRHDWHVYMDFLKDH